MADYKIKDLEQLTGIRAHTIRMWEKRYGILNPERTETQIRTYRDEELTLLLNISMLNKHGLKISRIADMSHQQIVDKVLEIREDRPSDVSQENLVLALIEMDELLFRSTLEILIADHGLEVTFSKHLLPFLERIGVMWMVGSINPAQEHFISNLIRQKIICEIDKLPVPDRKQPPILLFLPEHEWHEISLLFYQFILRNSGRNTVYIGQSLPFDALLECIDKIKPVCLITSWLTSVDERFVKSYFKRLWEESNHLPVYAGGYQILSHGHLITNWAVRIDSVTDIKQLVQH
jgi:DNA-binding transcriptional MerR regulator